MTGIYNGSDSVVDQYTQLYYRMLKPRTVLLLFTLFMSSACASRFPSPNTYPAGSDLLAQETGSQIFKRTLQAHGGDSLSELKNLNVEITGEWKALIKRIQPLVTDYNYRVDSQERLMLDQRIYAANYKGPGGSKAVFRSPQEVTVFYNQQSSLDEEVLSSTALTADAFFVFLLGPLGLAQWSEAFVRISNARHGGKQYQRIYLERKPGFGYAASDEIVLWVDPDTSLTKMIQITLTGHASTQAAHVEVEYLDYTQMGPYTFPSDFYERVNAPIAINAHAWRLTGLDINRSYSAQQLSEDVFTGAALEPAQALP